MGSSSQQSMPVRPLVPQQRGEARRLCSLHLAELIRFCTGMAGPYSYQLLPSNGQLQSRRRSTRALRQDCRVQYRASRR